MLRPSPRRPERARLTHSVPHLTGSLKGLSPLVRRSRHSSPVRLSTAVSCTCWWNSEFPPSFPISGSVQMTPRFPPAGPDGHGSPPSAVLSGRYDFLPSHVLRLIVLASRFRGRLPGSCPPWGAPAAVQVRRRAGVWIVHAGRPLSSVLAHGQEQDLPGSLATRPVTLRRPTTPDDPLRLAIGGAPGAAPTRLTMKASSIDRFRGLPRRFITCCLRFTTGVAARHARLASGWPASPLPGGSRTRWVATRGFRSWHPPLQGLAWRNIRSVVG